MFRTGNRQPYYHHNRTCTKDDKDDTMEENFYEILEETYSKTAKYDMTILTEDFNTKIGNEKIPNQLKQTILTMF